MKPSLNCIIMGAAGRDFHDFQTFFRTNPSFRVQAFTATQIPFIESRSFPVTLAGPEYKEDIPVFAEERLPELIRRFDIDFVFLAYSDLHHEDVMHKASLVQSCGAAFSMLGPKQTQLKSSRPVISVTATRTGAGKSPIAQLLASHLIDAGYRVGVLRHPMPYGNLEEQAVQRFETFDDLNRHDCTVEEREEYEPYIAQGMTIFAGVDYAAVLTAAEAESDVILWDGGNNDYSFVRPTLSIVVADALRPGHEAKYYPGESNFRCADVIVINKVSQAGHDNSVKIMDSAQRLNPSAVVVTADLEIAVSDTTAIEGRRVLVVEDGPTLTHGGMSYGAATVAARQCGAQELIDPRPFAVGSIKALFQTFPHLGCVLPAVGYSVQQRHDLAATIRRSNAETVVDGSPASLTQWIDPDICVVRVQYRFVQRSGPSLVDFVREAVASGPRPVE